MKHSERARAGGLGRPRADLQWTRLSRHRPTGEKLKPANQYSRAETAPYDRCLLAHAADATDAIHEYFRRAHAQGERNVRRSLRIGGFTLAVALGVLAGSFGLRRLLSNLEAGPLVRGLREGLLILVWVAIWCPGEILLLEEWESHLKRPAHPPPAAECLYVDISSEPSLRRGLRAIRDRHGDRLASVVRAEEMSG